MGIERFRTTDKIETLITQDRIAQRICELGMLISNDYNGKDLLVIGILRGAFIFLADLVRNITIPLATDFVSISSYRGSITSSGIVKVTKDIEYDVSGKSVLIVEDIVDTGWTIKMSYLMENFIKKGAESVKICTLLDKPSRRKVEIQLDYIGFEVPDEFVVGYGLDYNELYRNLPYIGIMKNYQKNEI